MGMIGDTAVAKNAAAVVNEVLKTACAVRVILYLSRIRRVASSDP